MTRRRCVGVCGWNISRFPTRGESLLLHLFDEHVERFFEDGPHVPVGNPVAKQILGLPELVMARATRSELELEGVLGEGSNHGPAFIASRRRERRRCERENR